ncbi:S41 family peptidase [Chitinophagaceae bacterium LB-8]|uniref:S41 family peptidase n=1 Tax=Paraflavisolibacter caeni TaxID=2982496 RepID=A0A9X3B6E0_9BACT|nr:S41 family peptidase [Paraflavisolibacter caeni]MCU7547895.1 S41 family peptidase [Paraflavisolibacter caeni]
MKRELTSDYEINNYGEFFKAFWNGVNTNYVFWDIETVNWDSMYQIYKPRFDSLDLKPLSDSTQNLCFQYLADMTKELCDGQFYLNIPSGGNFTFDGEYYKDYVVFMPKLFRTLKTHAALPDTLFDHIVQNNYLSGFDYGQYRNINTAEIFQIITGRISKGSKDILYTSMNNFMIKEGYNSTIPSTRPPARPVIKNFYDAIHKEDCDAVIIDIRNNRGGNLEDVDYLVGQFTTKPTLFGYTRYKSGVGRLDYTPFLPMSITPQANAKDFSRPVIILTDIYTSGLGETMVQAFKALPNAKVTLIGEKTFGSAGLISTNATTALGGPFTLGSFAFVRMSSSAITDENRKFNFSGFAPDIEVKYTDAGIATMLKTGVDPQLERAIQFINSK